MDTSDDDWHRILDVNLDGEATTVKGRVNATFARGTGK